jgi:hypothetical protein
LKQSSFFSPQIKKGVGRIFYAIGRNVNLSRIKNHKEDDYPFMLKAFAISE